MGGHKHGTMVKVTAAAVKPVEVEAVGVKASKTATDKDKGTAKAKAKAKSAATAAKADDDAVFAAAMALADAERVALASACAAEAARLEVAAVAARARAAEEAARGAREEDKPAIEEMPSLVMPSALTAEPTLLQMLQRTDPTASVKGRGGAAPSKPRDYSKETPRERELRMREARARVRVMRQAMAQRRAPGGKEALERAAFTEPAVYYGDETADEIATRPQLIQAHVKRYAEWLVEGMKGTKLLDNAATCPDQFALVFRFDATLDPVCRHPKSKLGSQLDVLIVCFKRVLYFVWSDYADGLLAALDKKLLDVIIAQNNIVEVLPDGKRPTGLGLRITKTDELAKMPYLNSEFYPHGIPAELVLKKRPWGSDLGAESGVERLARALAADDDALDSESDGETSKDKDKDKGKDKGNVAAAEIRKEMQALGRNRFPLSQAILDAFRPEYEDMPAAGDAAGGGAGVGTGVGTGVDGAVSGDDGSSSDDDKHEDAP